MLLSFLDLINISLLTGYFNNIHNVKSAEHPSQ